MKKLLLILFALPLLWACGDDDKPVQKVWNPDKMVLIKPDKTAFKTVATKGDAETSEHLSALEIVKQGRYIEFMVTYEDTGKLEKPYSGRRGFAEEQKDFTIPALKMWGTDIINDDGNFVKHFIYGYDMVVCTVKGDTIAYIPNKTLEDCREPLETAYNEGKYEDVYQMFDNTFKFRPITGAEWRELKKQGKQ